jgi:hypothetical protein
MDNTRDRMAERLQLALDMHEAGVELMRARLRREHPDADEATLDAMLTSWLRQRPGAEFGDSAGSPRLGTRA